MSVTYNKTNWVNEVTPLDADNMNNIENGIESLVNAVNEGGGGSTITIDDSLSNTSTNPVQNKVITLALDTKVNKETGKVLSTNDFTNADKTKLDSLENYNDSEIKAEIATKQDIIQYSVMPEASADLVNKIVQYIGNNTTTYTQGLFYKCVYATTKYQWQKISVSSDDSKLNKPDTISASAKLVTYSLATGTGIKDVDTSIGSGSTDNGIPTSKAVYTEVNKKISATTPSINESGNWVIGTEDSGVSAKGIKGDKGDKGDTGAKGADGKTPVKGTDYFTEADKQELVNAVIAALPNGNGVAY